jgi:hypothetical protein
MPSKKPLIALRVADDLYEKIRTAAAADGRTMTNYLDFYLRRAMLNEPEGRVLAAGGLPVSPYQSNIRTAVHPGRQVHLEEQIAAVVKRGPVKPARHK